MIKKTYRLLTKTPTNEKNVSPVQRRIALLSTIFLCSFVILSGRMVMLATTKIETPVKQTTIQTSGMQGIRANIVDRKNRILAMNVTAGAVYVHPHELDEPVRIAKELATIFQELDANKLYTQFISGKKFVWIARPVTPRQMEQVYGIGGSGVYVGTHPRRIYPGETVTSHLMGGVRYGIETVNSAELVGVGGIEYALNERLSKSSEPVAMSIDLRVQNAVHDVLKTEGLGTYNAKGGAAIVMDVHTGEIVSLVSLPDFDANNRPRVDPRIPESANTTFNRAVQGVYELGSVYKVIAAALAMERGIVTPETIVDPRKAYYVGRKRIRDDHPIRKIIPFKTAMAKSSNIVISKLMLDLGKDEYKNFLDNLGLFDKLDMELAEVTRATPLVPPRWGDIHVVTASYGHGFSSTVMHLAKAYASLVNGGTLIHPTLLQSASQTGKRMISAKTSENVRNILQEIVSNGTGRKAQVKGYEIGGKTGTAEKPRLGGRGYDKTKVISTFAGIFPVTKPKYVIVVSLDEPTHYINGRPFRSAGWTAAPTTGAIISRIAPLLGMQPMLEEEEVVSVLP